jgi:hypothetical protein
MPSQAVEAIDEIFPHAKHGPVRNLGPGDGYNLRAVLTLVNSVPGELINVPTHDYSLLVRATSTIEYHLATWLAHGSGAHGYMADLGRVDMVTIVRRVMVLCTDDYPSHATIELLFITDVELRDVIRGDIGAANWALLNSEWKAATVLAGAAIEALLLWSVQQPANHPRLQAAALAVVRPGGLQRKPRADPEDWVLPEYIEVAAELGLIKADTRTAALLAKDFRNLIHPGRSSRVGQVCNRGTAMSAIAALEHVVTDLT